jgi:hypothetical protein
MRTFVFFSPFLVALTTFLCAAVRTYSSTAKYVNLAEDAEEPALFI